MLRIFTASLDYTGEDRADITRGGIELATKNRLPIGPGAVLAPSRELLDWFFANVGDKNSVTARARLWPEYEARYTAEMRESYRRHFPTWEQLLAEDQLTLVCYCQRTPGYCHRRLAADFLAKAARGNAVFCGERWPAWILGAITLWPEWAYGVAALGKDCENRSQAYASVVGRWVAIHGGKCIGGSARKPPNPESLAAVDDLLETCEVAYEELGKPPPAAFQALAELSHPQQCEFLADRARGIVAIARVSECLAARRSPWFFGPWAYYFSDVVALNNPVPCRGEQGLWEVPSDVLRMVGSELPEITPAALRGYLGMKEPEPHVELRS